MVKQIELTKGQFAIVDDEYYDYLNQFSWHFKVSTKGGYAARCDLSEGYRRNCSMHRELYKLHYGVTEADIAGLDIDHENRNKIDNRISNLRLTTRRFNAGNREANVNNNTGYKGVKPSRLGDKNVFVAQIMIEGRKLNLGYYNTPEEAAIAFNIKALEAWGKFAYLNSVDMSKSINRISNAKNGVDYVAKGHSFNKRLNKWQAYGKDREGKRIHLGYHETKEQAQQTYEKFIISLKLPEQVTG